MVQVGPGTYVTACKPGMVGDGIRAAFTVTDSGQPVGATGTVAEQLAEAQASYVAYVKDQAGTLISGTEAFADAYASGDDDDRPRALRPDPRPLGADRARRGVVRRPRPPAGRPRGGPRRGRDLERLAPDREGPLAAGPRGQRRRGLRRADRRGAPGRGRPAGRPHPAARRQGQRPGVHVRGVPDRQRRQGAARRGRLGQGHRRGGDLVAHRPVGLPGERRRGVGRVRRPARRRRGRGPGLVAELQAKFDALNALLAAARLDRGRLRRYDELTEDRGPRARRRGRRRRRAPVPPHGRGHGRGMSDSCDEHQTPPARHPSRGRACPGGAFLGVAGGRSPRPGWPGSRASRSGGPRSTRSGRPPGRGSTRSRGGTRRASSTPAQDRMYTAAFDLTTDLAGRPRRPAPALDGDGLAAHPRPPGDAARVHNRPVRRPAGGHRRGDGPPGGRPDADARVRAVAVHRHPRGPRRPVRRRRPAPRRRSSRCRTSRATTWTPPGRTATSWSRPAPTTRRSRCTRSGT